MDLSLITNTTKNLGRTIDRNSPTILTALGVAGLVSTVILAIKATPKAEAILFHEADFRRKEWSEQTGEIEEVCPTDSFTPIEIVELTWKEYIPTVVMGAITISCMIGANHISLRRNAALASLLSIAETTLHEYQEKVKEQIGEKKEEKIRGEIAQDKLDANPPDEKTIILTGKGDYLCFDNFSGRYFRSDIETLRRAENAFNQRLLRQGWLSINEFYDEIGLERIDLGDEMGWIAERQLLELKFDSKNAKDYEPALVVNYRVSPHHI
jgi:hypothetical protein